MDAIGKKRGFKKTFQKMQGQLGGKVPQECVLDWKAGHR